MLPPPGFHKWPVPTHFHCPFCTHRSRHVTLQGWFRPKYWCEKCGRYSRLEAAALIGAVWGVFIPVVFFSVYFLVASTYSGLDEGGSFAITFVVAVPLLLFVIWPAFSRLTHRYESAEKLGP
jgi:hypothetical protein